MFKSLTCSFRFCGVNIFGMDQISGEAQRWRLLIACEYENAFNTIFSIFSNIFHIPSICYEMVCWGEQTIR